jgi:phosphoribosyl-ATP pyrophosphohydrolase
VLAKVDEEASEVIAAAGEEDAQALVHEVADLWFHCLVLMAARGLHPREVLGRQTGE